MIVNKELIGKRFLGCSFDNFVRLRGNELAFSGCKNFVAERNGSLILIGPPGRGKTHLLVAAISELDRPATSSFTEGGDIVVDRGVRIVYFPQYDLVRGLRQDVVSGTKETLRECLGADVLAIDDLGVGGDITPFFIESMEYIIDHRYKNLLKTIITTNLSLQELSRAFSPRIASRVAEEYAVIAITTESDYRLTQRKVGD